MSDFLTVLRIVVTTLLCLSAFVVFPAIIGYILLGLDWL